MREREQREDEFGESHGDLNQGSAVLMDQGSFTLGEELKRMDGKRVSYTFEHRIDAIIYFELDPLLIIAYSKCPCVITNERVYTLPVSSLSRLTGEYLAVLTRSGLAQCEHVREEAHPSYRSLI